MNIGDKISEKISNFIDFAYESDYLGYFIIGFILLVLIFYIFSK